MSLSAGLRILAFLGAIAAVALPGDAATFAADDYVQIKGAIHLDTTISGGEMTVGETLALAKAKGLDLAIITDHDVDEWEYGLFPLRGIIKKKVKQGSILGYGAQKYIDAVNEAAAAHPDLVVLYGSESIPFYYWEGEPRRNSLTLRSAGVHLLAIGLESAGDYQGMPSVANGFPRRYGLAAAVRAWPLGLLALGIYLNAIKRKKKVVFGKLNYSSTHRPYLFIGVLFFLTGAVFSYNNFPFAPPIFDQYHGSQGAAPYQLFIDYVNEKGGMVFWAHPEAGMKREVDGVRINTEPYHDLLLQARDYAGFAVFAEGMKYILPPGGIWDKVLLQYLEGSRRRPAWAIGEVDLELKKSSIDSSLTMLLVKEKSRRAALDALRSGRAYAVHGPRTSSITLDRFTVSDEATGRAAGMGDWIQLGGDPKIEIEVRTHSKAPEADLFTVDVIRNGGVIKSFRGRGGETISFVDPLPAGFSKGYYRLDVKGRYARIASNPIFARVGR